MPSRLSAVIAIALGAALGANLRYFLSEWVAYRWGSTFPYGTLLINSIGSFSIGFLTALTSTKLILPPYWRLLLITGLLGGFTTFSAFSYEVYLLLIDERLSAACLYILSSIGIGLIAVLLGMNLARMLGQ